MLHYQFPLLYTLDDVLPAIEQKSDFRVYEKEDYFVVNYTVNFPDTFDMKDANDLYGAIRRECRGLIFNKQRKLVSRPFHKFFNIGEREELQIHRIDLSLDHSLLLKEDGSFVRPLLINGEIRWATKMGITDVSCFVEKFVKKNKKYEEFARFCIENDLTPIFEYVGPYNRIILSYEKENMILLAVRKNFSGEYIPLHI